MKHRISIATFAFFALCGSALAATPETLGQFRDWTAFRMTEGGRSTCWIVSKPQDSEPKNVRRDDIYIFVTHRPSERVTNEVSVITGYTYDPQSVAKAAIENKKFEMFTDGDGAWLYKPEEDAKMVDAMKAGSRMIVQGTSNRGTLTTDSYSLLGFTAAHKAISEACRLR